MKKIILILITCTWVIQAIGQEKEFKIPEENNGYFTLKVRKNDKVSIKEDSAYVISSATFKGYQELQNSLRKCLAQQYNMADTVIEKFEDFNETITRVQKMADEWKGISDDILKKTEEDLTRILENLKKDINELKDIQEAIDKARDELDDVGKRLRKERMRLFWAKLGQYLVATGLGIVIGVLM
jgi:DNA repair ATPase RecN